MHVPAAGLPALASGPEGSGLTSAFVLTTLSLTAETPCKQCRLNHAKGNCREQCACTRNILPVEVTSLGHYAASRLS